MERGRRQPIVRVQHYLSPLRRVVRARPLQNHIANASTEQRGASLTPLQSLYFLNGEFPRRCAAELAKTLSAPGVSDKDRIAQAFLTVYGRPPSAAETERSLAFLHTASDAYTTHGAKPLSPQQLALQELVKAMFASNEFMFVD